MEINFYSYSDKAKFRNRNRFKSAIYFLLNKNDE